jgi:hypothetical protein
MKGIAASTLSHIRSPRTRDLGFSLLIVGLVIVVPVDFIALSSINNRDSHPFYRFLLACVSMSAAIAFFQIILSDAAAVKTCYFIKFAL